MKRRMLLYAPPAEQVNVRFIQGVGPKGAELLASSRFEIRSVQDLLQHYPRRHLDFTDQRSIGEVHVGDEVMVIGEVKRVNAPPPSARRRKLPTKVVIYDGTSKLTLAFFNQPWRAKQLPVGTMVAARGKVSRFRNERQMTSPLVDVVKEAEEPIKIVPIYPATADIHTAWLRRIIRAALESHAPVADPLPDEMLDKHNLIDRTSALRWYHFPDDMREVFEARRRLVFDELFTLQIGLAYRKRRIEQSTVGIVHSVKGDLTKRFLENLPFELTKAQLRAIEEITADLVRPVPMHRLLQGEVGSGKTVVAVHAALAAVQGGYQAAIMAPTEVLANQHYLTITRLLSSLAGDQRLFGGPEVVLLTGSTPSAQRRKILEKVADGSAPIVVGTHALIQEGVEFSNLGFVVVDEQHRFGVHQRLALKQKAEGGSGGVAAADRDRLGGASKLRSPRDREAPDVLVMTATPIPRTLALTLYGDLDVSVLDELPKGRKPVKTEVIDDVDRKIAYDLVRREVAAGRQAYVICPLVDESDKLQVRSAEKEAQRLATEVFPDLSVGKIHGRLRPATKESVMEKFRSGEIDVLISTTVIEVGVDVPNASVMLIEDADRFGLSQLHQLRGRIGRGEHESTCILLTGVMDLPEDERRAARERLQAVASSNDGFDLAEKDLEIRGPGQLMGEQQAGWFGLKLAHPLKDLPILNSAREEAFAIIRSDPDLEEQPLIRKEMEGRFADRLEWLFHS